jgi:hypothetical protein
MTSPFIIRKAGDSARGFPELVRRDGRLLRFHRAFPSVRIGGGIRFSQGWRLIAVSLAQFRDWVIDSGLVSASQLQALVADLPEERRPADGEQLARLLVQQRKLTAFQAQQIYAGSGQPGAFRSWLRSILVHRLRNFWRARSCRPQARGDSDSERRLRSGRAGYGRSASRDGIVPGF